MVEIVLGSVVKLWWFWLTCALWAWVCVEIESGKK